MGKGRINRKLLPAYLLLPTIWAIGLIAFAFLCQRKILTEKLARQRLLGQAVLLDTQQIEISLAFHLNQQRDNQAGPVQWVLDTSENQIRIWLKGQEYYRPLLCPMTCLARQNKLE